MPNRPAPALVLRAGDRAELARWTCSSAGGAGRVQRARIVLAAADGTANQRIAQWVGVSKMTVLKWRSRYAAHGLAGLADGRRSGRPRQTVPAEILAATLTPPPAHYGVTQWSTRLLAQHLGVGNGTVARAWRACGIRPGRFGTFRFATDPELVAKAVEVVGLRLSPAENAIVLRVNEGSRPQSPNRTDPERRPGTALLVAALKAVSVDMADAAGTFGPHQPDGPEFLERVLWDRPLGELCLVTDGLPAHQSAEVRAWLAANPRVRVHFAPTSDVWFALVEVWFEITRRPPVRREQVDPLCELDVRIREFVAERPAGPFVWTPTAGANGDRPSP